MKQRIQSLVSEKALKWARLVGITGGGQVAVQLLAFASGLAVIRLLSVEEYAFYTLAMTMLGAMGVIADGGVSAGVMVEGGKTWRDKQKLGAVISCGMQLRRKLAVPSLALGLPLLIFLLLRNGATWAVAGGICVVLVPAFLTVLSTPILDAPLRLHQQVWPLARINVGNGLLRLAAMVPLLMAWPAAAGAILVNGFSAVVANHRIRRVAMPYAEARAQASPEITAPIVALVRRMMPNTIYYSFSSQLTIWLVSVFGGVAAIAQVGALSRIGLVLAVVKSIIMTLLVPRFTKLGAESPLMVRRFIQVQSLLWLLSIVMLVSVYVFAKPILWLLGPEYDGLHAELLIMTAASLCGLAAFTAEKLSQSRGWVIAPQYFIPCALALQLALAASLRPSSAFTAFAYGLCIQFAFYVAYTLFFLRRAASRASHRNPDQASSV